MDSAGGSNSNSTSNPSSALPAESLPRHKVESQLVERFVSVMQRRLEEIRMRQNTNTTTTMDGGNQFALEEKERKLLLDLNRSGLLQGVVAGVVSLVFLRRIRAGFLRRMIQQRDAAMARGSTNGGTPHVRNSPFAQQQPPPPPPPPPSPNASNQDYYSSAAVLDRAIRQRQGGLHFPYILGWTLDALTAFMAATSASLLFTDVDKVMQALAELPLIEGRSRVAEEFCPDIVLELARLQKEAQASNAVPVLDAVQAPETPALQAIVRFTQNCQKRAAYERQLRREKGVSDTFPVSIPSPGVPAGMSYRDEDYTDPEEFGGLYPENNHQESFDANDGSSGASSSGDTWTDSFVSDFEDEQKRGKK